MLMKFWLHGAEELDKITANPVPYPVSGLYDVSHFYEEVDDIYEKGIGSGVSTGYDEVDELYTIVEGQLTVVTGHPSSGKSEFVDQIMVNIARDKGWKFGICSFENEPRIHIAKLISKYVGKPFFDGITPRVTKEDLDHWEEVCARSFFFLYQADGSLSTLDSIIERMKVAVMRHGIRGVVIDPYNYISKEKHNLRNRLDIRYVNYVESVCSSSWNTYLVCCPPNKNDAKR